MKNGYSVRVAESSKALTAREKIMYSDTSNATKLDDLVTLDSPMVITPAEYAVLSVHNERSENVDYEVFVIIDTNNNKYVTGSQSFWNSFSDIWATMHEEEINEEYDIEIYKKESKNYKGKYFLTCSIV